MAEDSAPAPAPVAASAAEVTRYAPLVARLFDALAQNAGLSVDSWKQRVRHIVDRQLEADWSAHARLERFAVALEHAVDELARDPHLHGAAESKDERSARIGRAFDPSPGIEIGLFSVTRFRRLVAIVHDPTTELSRAELAATLVDNPSLADEYELGDDVGREDAAETRALRMAVLRELGLDEAG